MARMQANPTGRNRAFLLLALFGLGLDCLAVPQAAKSGMATEWVRKYNGPGNGDDAPKAIAVDSQGNVLVTGSSSKGEYHYGYLTIKYSPSGKRLWSRRYDGLSNGSSHATAMVMDHQDNVLVTGYTEGADTGLDYVTIKYNPDGKQLWLRRYNGPGNGQDFPNAIGVDAQGNVYVTGHSWSGTSSDFLTIKYSPDGKRIWARRYNGTENSAYMANAMAVDANGNVYVIGSSYPSHGDDWMTTIKYNTDGRLLWVASHLGPTVDLDAARAIAVDAQGNVYVSGGNHGYFLTIKYSPEGQQLWERQDGKGKYGSPESIAVDPAGNVYVTGTSATLKYSNDGQLLWKLDSYAEALALDPQSNVYITGFPGETFKYSSLGEEMWVGGYKEPGSNYYRTQAIALDKQGNVYVTGYSWPNAKYITIKYTQSPRTGP